MSALESGTDNLKSALLAEVPTERLIEELKERLDDKEIIELFSGEKKTPNLIKSIRDLFR